MLLFICDVKFVSMHTAPLAIAGPHDLKIWFERAFETAFPGVSTIKQSFKLSLGLINRIACEAADR